MFARTSPRWPAAVRLLAASCALAIALTSCAAWGRGKPPSAGPTLNLLTTFPATLDPAQANGGDATTFLQSVFSGLVRYDAGGNLRPDLAETWTIDEARTTYTFTLRPNATFQNGAPVTAQAFVYAINRACDPRTGSPIAGDYLEVIQGVSDRLASKASTVSGVVADAPGRLRIVLTHPDEAFLARLTFPLTFALDQASVESGGADWWMRANGSGPFRLTQWEPNRSATLERSPGYYGPAPSVARVVLHNPAALGDLGKAFGSGALDLLPLAPGSQELVALLDPKAKVPAEIRRAFRVYDYPALEYLVLNSGAPPFDDPLVRQAMNLVFDKAQLVYAAAGNGGLGGFGWPAAGILPPSMPGYRREFAPYPSDARLAQGLLRRSRYANAQLRITLASGDELPDGTVGPLTSAVATTLQQALGWTIQLNAVREGELSASLARGQFAGNMALTGWQADYGDPQDFLDLLFHSGRSSNFARYRNPQVDHLLEQADQTADSAGRIALYSQAQDLIMHDAPIVPLFFDRRFVLVNPRVVSLPLLPDGSLDLRDARVS